MHVRVREHLEASGATYRIRDHTDLPVAITSPADFAAALGYPIGRILKTVLCRSGTPSRHLAVVCSVDARIDFKVIAQQLNWPRIEVAKIADLEAVTGYPRGSVSPLGLGDDVRVVLARRSLDYDTVLIGGGASGIEVEIAPTELVRITGATDLEFDIPT